jgi:hypothetical protein
MNLIEKTVGKISIFLFKRDTGQIRREREWKEWIKYSILKETSQITYRYVREDIVKTIENYHNSKAA